MAIAVLESKSHADLALIPARLQVDLLAKAATYDRNFAKRADARVHVLIIKTTDPESTLAAGEIREALSNVDTIGNLPHETRVETFVDGEAIARSCRVLPTTVVYLGLGLGDRMASIREALGKVDVLSVAGRSEYVADGAVLGFELVSGRPKLVVNLTQARLQHVDFRAEFLKLCKVYE